MADEFTVFPGGDELKPGDEFTSPVGSKYRAGEVFTSGAAAKGSGNKIFAQHLKGVIALTEI